MTDSREDAPRVAREGDPLDEACRSIDDKKSVDWSLTDSKISDPAMRASARALRDLERIAEVHRGFQQPTEPGNAQTPHVSQPEPWGHLTILELARAGTSGEVWRAWDPWLQREVALKFLTSSGRDVPDDSALLEEARALARIRHSGVVNVYGIAAHQKRVGMWMEFLEGSTLEGEIDRRGPLPPSEVAKIGVDLCRALDAVVAAGLVHRDIKPANIVLEPNGRTVLTDFGLGKRASVTDREAWRSSGTPLFMAPELLAGEAATSRSDLYALGVTLRWALTGRAPFRARSLQELRAEAEAGPSTRLLDERPDAPPALVQAIETAMAPQAEERHATAAGFAESLEESLEESGVAPKEARRPLLLAVGGMLLLGVVTTLLIGELRSKGPSTPQGHFTIQATPGTKLAPFVGDLSISPDGRLVAFVASDSTLNKYRIWVRPLNTASARPLEGTENPSSLFWSPDSREIGFFSDRTLKKVAVFGGAPTVLCEAVDPRGGTWGKEGVIVFAPHPAGGIYSVKSEGGEVVEIQRPDTTAHETALRWPQFLPDGKRFFFVSLPPRDEKFDVFVASLTSRGRRHVMRAGCAPTVAGDRGVVVAEEGQLMLQGFDYDRLTPKGSPVAIATAPFTNKSVGQPLASASLNGVIVHLHQPLARTEVALLDRSGRRREVVPLPPGRYEAAYFSPDGTRLLAQRRDAPNSVEIWLVDIPRGQSRRFSMGSQTRLGGSPSWSPDGDRIAFSSNRAGRTNIYERLVDEAGEERLLFESDGQFKEVNAWSPDGEFLVFEQASDKTSWDLWMIPLKQKGPAIPYLASRFNEIAASISPDGRWAVYTGDQSDKHELFVRSFPNPGPEISVFDGFGRAMWVRSGREILVANTRDGWIWSVPVTTHPTFQAEPPRRLFRTNSEALWTTPAPSGDRFVEVVPAERVEPPSIMVEMNVPRP